MEQLLWSEHLSLNVPHIDQAHKQFLEQLAAVANSPEATLKEALVGLIRDMETDFRQEEALMEKIGYPDIKPHREQHARVLSSFHQVMPEVLKGDFSSARHVLDLLPSWLVLHITTMDKGVVMFMEHQKLNG